jgi:hypothetical protein
MLNPVVHNITTRLHMVNTLVATDNVLDINELETFPLRLDYGRSPHAYVNQRLQIQLELLIMIGVPLETC